MKRNTSIVTILALIGALGAGAAIAANQGLLQLPDEVKAASLRVPEGLETQADFAKLATITQQQAEAAALTAQPGQVVKAKLDDENGYLVWQVDVQHDQGTTDIKVDAGNGKVLAADTDEDEDHEHEGHEDHEDRG